MNSWFRALLPFLHVAYKLPSQIICSFLSQMSSQGMERARRLLLNHLALACFLPTVIRAGYFMTGSYTTNSGVTAAARCPHGYSSLPRLFNSPEATACFSLSLPSITTAAPAAPPAAAAAVAASGLVPVATAASTAPVTFTGSTTMARTAPLNQSLSGAPAAGSAAAGTATTTTALTVGWTTTGTTVATQVTPKSLGTRALPVTPALTVTASSAPSLTLTETPKQDPSRASSTIPSVQAAALAGSSIERPLATAAAEAGAEAPRPSPFAPAAGVSSSAASFSTANAAVASAQEGGLLGPPVLPTQIMFDPALLALLLPPSGAATPAPVGSTPVQVPLPATVVLTVGVPVLTAPIATPIPNAAAAAIGSVALAGTSAGVTTGVAGAVPIGPASAQLGCGLNKYSTGEGTCADCPENRYTITNRATSKANCLVQPGFGVVAKSSSPEDTPVEQCLLGWFSKGGAVDSLCLPCQRNTWTEGPGATDCSGKRYGIF